VMLQYDGQLSSSVAEAKLAGLSSSPVGTAGDECIRQAGGPTARCVHVSCNQCWAHSLE